MSVVSINVLENVLCLEAKALEAECGGSFILDSYGFALGSLYTFRDDAVSLDAPQGVVIVMSYSNVYVRRFICGVDDANAVLSELRDCVCCCDGGSVCKAFSLRFLTSGLVSMERV